MRPDTFERVRKPDCRTVILLLLFLVVGLLPAAVHGQALHDLVVAGVVNISGPAPMIVQRVAQVFEDHLEGPE